MSFMIYDIRFKIGTFIAALRAFPRAGGVNRQSPIVSSFFEPFHLRHHLGEVIAVFALRHFGGELFQRVEL